MARKLAAQLLGTVTNGQSLAVVRARKFYISVCVPAMKEVAAQGQFSVYVPMPKNRPTSPVDSIDRLRDPWFSMMGHLASLGGIWWYIDRKSGRRVGTRKHGSRRRGAPSGFVFSWDPSDR